MKKTSCKKILLVEDDELFRKTIKACLEEKYDVAVAESAEAALNLLSDLIPDLILLDLNLPKMNGADFLKKIKPKYPSLPVIMLTAIDSIPKIVETIKLGAYDYLTKPVDESRLNLTIARALEAEQIRRELEQRRNLQVDLNRDYKLLGESDSLKKTRAEIAVVAKTDSTVLIQGETGTGKELVAREIHANSLRAEGPFVPINCGAIPKDLIESEMFGQKKGAFTGAQNEPGKFRLAEGGTLLLDEISELPLKAQTKLLRALQEKEFYPVGSTELVKVDVRVLASTNKDLQQMVEKGRFRSDLFYRLNVYTIIIPPLRERPDDIITLANHFIQKNNIKFGKNIRKFSTEAKNMMLNHPWKGNVRELENLIERIALFAESEVIEPDALNFIPSATSDSPAPSSVQIPEKGLDFELESLEKKIIEKALEMCKWNKTEAAKLLKLSRPAFEYRLEKHRLN